MTPEQIIKLVTPLPGDASCGPDLEAAGDSDYLNFVARIENILPSSFAAFDPASISYKSELEILARLLERSRDLRLLVLLAKLLILKKDLPGYVAVFWVIEQLVEESWDHLVPPVDGDNADFRVGVIQSLDEMPGSVLPLQVAPLFETRRFGVVSYRSHLLAAGETQPRSSPNDPDVKEMVPDPALLQAALDDVPLEDLTAARDLCAELRRSTKNMEVLVGMRTRRDGILRFRNLHRLADPLVAFLDNAVVKRDPALGLVAVAPALEQAATDANVAASKIPDPDLPAIGSGRDASRALAAVGNYFAGAEPSSPILLLVRQAQALIGRNFFEAMRELLPDLSSQARLRVGQQPTFALRLERLAELQPPDNEQLADEGLDAGGESRFVVADRATALALLRHISRYFRATEPSSPVPLLLDRADGFAGKDFTALLREAFPDGTVIHER